MSSVAVSSEFFCAPDSHPSTIFAKWFIEWLSPPASPFFPPQTLYLWICGPGGLEGRGSMSSLLLGTLSWACDFWWENRGKDRYMFPAIAGGFYGKLVKAGEVKTRLGQCKAGEETSLLYGSGNTSPLRACCGDDGFNESIASFLMNSVVSSRCAKSISCNGD